VALRYEVRGWLRLVGSFKLHASVAEYRLFYRALLQKRPIIGMPLTVSSYEKTETFVGTNMVVFFRFSNTHGTVNTHGQI